MKIIVRGDCCSRRAVNFNKDLFGGRPMLVQDEKSRTDFLLDAVARRSPSVEDVRSVMDLDQMSAVHRTYAETQVNRRTLAVQDADLVLMDCYADMNFRAWRHREEGWKIWVNFKFLCDKAAFDTQFQPLPQLDLEESIRLSAQLIERYREQCGREIPVLYLTQPWHHYPRLDDRRQFDQVGTQLEATVPNCFHGRIDENILEPADIGSCGPGLTLHYTGASYRAMIMDAIRRGLGDALALKEEAG